MPNNDQISPVEVFSLTNDNNLSVTNVIGPNLRSSLSDESKKSTLIMVLWVSVVFSASRVFYAVSNLLLLLMEDSAYYVWASAFCYFFSACTYSSYIFVYVRTNKLFRKKFYEMFFPWRKKSTSINR